MGFLVSLVRGWRQAEIMPEEMGEGERLKSFGRHGIAVPRGRRPSACCRPQSRNWWRWCGREWPRSGGGWVVAVIGPDDRPLDTWAVSGRQRLARIFMAVRRRTDTSLMIASDFLETGRCAVWREAVPRSAAEPFLAEPPVTAPACSGPVFFLVIACSVAGSTTLVPFS